ncbi:dTDP-4-amino-4,6-dideoxygalactose transaminase [Desulfonatronum thiosulfatophilum]|uniref:dTDP-4-amino-4,6-dideoxygalactose transaminase n=2 Tax=Desulfonatronum thiosulfatophilum TaxID=617002 RepID=A0A1G6EKJ6_9BACT|nr:dTDP-4-amino-4,6-dideoxygalactose transaminase [Desulfonatronum thiosulfatophilum]
MLLYNIPPAETRLSWTALSKGFIPGRSDFSGKIRNLTSGRACILAGSARILLYLLFKELRGQAGPEKSEVLLPGYTCYSVAAAAVKAGLRVALYDLNPRTFQPDLHSVERALSDRTLAVVGQHLLGMPADLEPLISAAQRHGVCLIEDSAQFMASNQTKQFSTGADFTVYSFGRGKPLPLGGGGALIANSPKATTPLKRIAEAVLTSPNGSKGPMAPAMTRIMSWPRLYWMLEKLPIGLGRTVYDPGFPVTSMAAALQRIGTAALSDLALLNQHRAMIGEIYIKGFQSGPTQGSLSYVPSCVRFPILVRCRDKMRQLAAYGVRRLYPMALVDLPALRSRLADPVPKTFGAREIAQRMVTLPTHLGVDQRLAEIIVNIAQAAFEDIQTVTSVTSTSGTKKTP